MTGLDPASISIDNPITGYCVEYYDPLTGDTVPDLLDGVVGGTDTSIVSSIAYEDTLRLKVSSKNNPAQEPLPPYLANFIVTAQPSVKLVEVPMVVAMPPTRVAKPMGIRILLGDLLVRRHTDMRIGSNSTTMGVLLIKAERTAPITKVSSNDSTGSRPHN